MNEGNLKDPAIIAEQHKYVDERIVPKLMTLELTASVREAFIKRLHVYIDRGLFAAQKNAPPAADAPPFSVRLEPGKMPRSQKQRQWSPEMKKNFKPVLEQWLKGTLVSPSKSRVVSNMVGVKKPDGSTRFCVDYRDLNNVTIPRQFPLPSLEDLQAMAGSRWHSIIDCASAFLQTPVEDATKELLAFTTPFGVYEWNRMPFGVRNGPAWQQAFLNELLGTMGPQYGGYIDDIRVSSNGDLEHLVDLERLFLRCMELNVSLNLFKCNFFQPEARFMGCIITREGIRPDPTRLDALRQLELPKTRADLQSALGVLGFNRKFIPGYSTIARPLFDLTRKDVPFIWTTDHERAFRSLISTLCDSPGTLHYPIPGCEFVVFTDGSQQGLGACLCQRVPDTTSPDGWCFKTLSWDSRGLRGSEERYAPTDLEALAVVWAVGTQYRHYLLGQPFTVVTDHSALTSVFVRTTPSARVERWKMELSEFFFRVEYRRGRLNHVDYLSRHPHAPAPGEYEYFTLQQERWRQMWNPDLTQVPPPVSVPGMPIASPLEHHQLLKPEEMEEMPDLVDAMKLEGQSAVTPPTILHVTTRSAHARTSPQPSSGSDSDGPPPLVPDPADVDADDDDGAEWIDSDESDQLRAQSSPAPVQPQHVNTDEKRDDDSKVDVEHPQPKVPANELTFDAIKAAQKLDWRCQMI